MGKLVMNRYVGGKASDGYVVRDTWTGKDVEKHSSRSDAMKRVVEANTPYIEAEVKVHGRRGA